jgi:hypothetical protein
MPGSPASSTTRPSPCLACSHRRSRRSVSSFRPTRVVSPDRSASNRLSMMLSPNTAQARASAVRPLRLTLPRSLYWKSRPTSRRVSSETTTVPGSARVWRRAARFGASPTTDASRDAPEPMRSPTTTTPVAIPTRVRSVPAGPAIVSRRETTSTIRRPARTARSASSSSACG